jgi:large subunit ribosomal protein L23
MKEELYSVIKCPLVTEKSTLAAEQNNQYVFEVFKTATKGKIKEAIEALFNVTVTSVNTSNSKGKLKIFKGRRGKRNDTKKAVVSITKGQTIDTSVGV